MSTTRPSPRSASSGVTRWPRRFRSMTPTARPSDHAAAVTCALPRHGDVVVVAQSLGAFAGPLVCAAAPVRQLILLAPMIPRPGETAGEWWGDTRHPEAIRGILERHGPMNGWGRDAIAEVFLHDVDPDVIRDTERFSGAPGEGMFTEPWPLATWPDVRTRVLVPSRRPAVPAELPAPCGRRTSGHRDRRDARRAPPDARSPAGTRRTSHRAGARRRIDATVAAPLAR